MENHLRLFIAASLPSELITRLDRDILTAPELRKSGLRPVPAQNLHLTLHFIGETPETKLPDIDSALERAVGGIAVFRVRLVGGGCFPNRRSPRVFWIGIDSEASQALGSLAKTVKNELQKAGIGGDPKPFRPHLTIARVGERFDADQDAGALLKKLDAFNSDPFEINEIVCCASDLSRGKPVYEKVIEKRLIG